MQAIGQQAIEQRKIQKVMYLSSERFTNEFIDAIQHNMLVSFRRRYRQTDVLLNRRHSFLGRQRASQQEFFHTFNTLFDGRKQPVLSSDRPASEIANLEQRLVSRFECGLTRNCSRRISRRQFGLQPHRSRSYMASNDPEFEQKAADIIGLYLQTARAFRGLLR